MSIARVPEGRTLRQIRDKQWSKDDLRWADYSFGWRLRLTVDHAIGLLIELLLDRREPGQRSVNWFVHDAVRLFACVYTLNHRLVVPQKFHDIVDEGQPLGMNTYRNWPTTPGLIFGGVACDSAFSLIRCHAVGTVISCFSCGSIVDNERGGIDATVDQLLSTGDLERFGILWETRAKSSRARSWKDEWSGPLDVDRLPSCDELSNKQLPPSWYSLQSYFEDELRRYESGGADSAGSAAEGEYQSAQWFTLNTHVPTPRLRMAARPGRKSKHVRTKVIDGVTCYLVTDVRQWWSQDMSNPK